MKSNAKKNDMVFLGGTVVVAIAVFISFGIFAAPRSARAYAVGAVTTNAATAGATGGDYNIGGSLQNLISPFTGFVNSLKFNNNMTINTGGTVQSYPTVVNLTPAISNGARNIMSQWLSQFDNWFYGVSGVRLSGIFYVILNALAWTLGLAQRAVNWLLGLFH
jgi:hypothetical protein